MAAKKTTRKVLKFSPNAKLNYVLKNIYEDLKYIGKEEIDNHKHLFPRSIDFELVQGGTLFMYYDDIRNLYKKAGYAKSTIDRMSNDKLWETYCRQVGYVARNYF